MNVSTKAPGGRLEAALDEGAWLETGAELTALDETTGLDETTLVVDELDSGAELTALDETRLAELAPPDTDEAIAPDWLEAA
ncbi:MAG TPA: hypothetical protein PK297_08775 [Spirochaetota bacterium]|nr:hypothetical protein [Spirochaetota bacterium]